MDDLRQQLVRTALRWEQLYGNSPGITCALSEYDAAMLVGCSAPDYAAAMQGMTSVQRGYDFRWRGQRYQVKGNRPSGKRGSAVTWVPKASNYEWDQLVWVLYNPAYDVEEAWLWDVGAYRARFDAVKRLSPSHMRLGARLA